MTKSPSDSTVWKRYIQTVKPLKGKPVSVQPLRQQPLSDLGPEPTQQPQARTRKQFPPLPKRQLKNLHIHDRLDLHGLNQQQAHQKLLNFISQAQVTEKRCVLIITGKGLTTQPQTWWQKQGILRTMVPRWLEEEPLRSKITNYLTAKPEDGGAGALYVFIRKLK